MKRFSREAIPYLITLALVLLLYSPVFHAGRAFVLADAQDQNVPNRVFAGRALAAGRLPHWSNATFGGFPFLSDPQSAVFFPLNLALAAFYPDPGRSAVFDMFALTHIILLALGMVFLARSLGLGPAGAVGAAIAVTFNGYFIMHFSHTVIVAPVFCSLWGSGCLARAIRKESWKWSVGAGLFFASAIFAGHWQTALHGLYAAGVGGLVLVFREAFRIGSWQRLKTGVLVLALPFAIAITGTLVQVLPTLLLLNYSSRKVLPPAAAYVFSWPVAQFPGLLFPSLYQPLPWRIERGARFLADYKNWGVDGSYEFLFHAGFATITLAIVGWLRYWRRWPVQCLFWGALFVWVSAFGEAGGLYPLLYKYAPGFKQIRIPPRSMWIAAVTWGLLAGMGIDAVAARTRDFATRKAALAAAAFVAIIVTAGAATLLIARLGQADWFTTFNKLFVQNPAIIPNNVRPPGEFVNDIWSQVALGAVVGIVLCAWLIAAAKMQRSSGLLAALGIAAIYFELGAYGFTKNIGLEYPGYTHVTQDTLFDALPGRVRGRILAAYRTPGGKNGGFASGDSYVCGYNPLIIEWVGPFLPEEEFPNGAKDQERARDEWNVSHLAWQPSNVSPNINGKTMEIPWTGFVQLATNDPNRAAQMGWDVAGSRTPNRIHVILTAGCATGLEDGTTIGLVTLLGEGGDVITTMPLRAGIETAEWTYDNPNGPHPSHSKPKNSFVKPLDEGYKGGRFYVASLAVPTSAPLARVEITQTADAPTFLCVSHLLLEYPEVTIVRGAMDALGYKPAETRKSDWFFATRPHPLGWAWMVPKARAVSYKDEFKWVREDYFAPEFDPAKTVLVDKHQEPAESAAKLDAPDANTFSGKAQLKRGARPEEFSITTDSNQRGWLVISQTWYPGWTATLDGKLADLVQANGAHTALAVPEGRHKIEMKYYTPKFLLGACISGATWLAALLFLALPRRLWRRQQYEVK